MISNYTSMHKCIEKRAVQREKEGQRGKAG